MTRQEIHLTVLRAQQGNIEAQHLLWDQVRPVFLSVARSLGVEARELLGQLYIIFHKCLHDYRPDIGHFPGYCRARGRWLLIDYLRSRSSAKHREVLLCEYLKPDSDGAVDLDEFLERHGGLDVSLEDHVQASICRQHLIDSIPCRYREVATLILDGYTYSEVMRRANISRREFYRVRNQLAQAYLAYYEEG